jgi:hypothetical protein
MRTPEGFTTVVQIFLNENTIPDIRMALAEDNLRLIGFEAIPKDGPEGPPLTGDLLLNDTERALEIVNGWIAVAANCWRREGFTWPPPRVGAEPES